MEVPEIDPDAKNPRYADAMCLGDVVPNMKYVAVDTRYGYVEQVTLTSEWRVERDCSKWPKSGFSLLADDANGLPVNLCLEGIHPHFDGVWSGYRFAVRATDEKITALYKWMVGQRNNAVARSLQDQFPHLETILGEDFWKRINEHLGQHAK